MIVRCLRAPGAGRMRKVMHPCQHGIEIITFVD